MDPDPHTDPGLHVGEVSRTLTQPDVAPQFAATLDAQSLSGDDGEFERGALLGRYVVLDRLGAGGMGVVYAAYDPELDRKIALKLLRSGAGDREGHTRLLREAQAMAKLSHPNVVTVHDVGAFGARVFVAMEFVQGATLKRWLSERPRTWREILAVFVAAGRGLVAAHATGLIHRDLKPDNIMLGDDGRVRVMDFGLARASAEVAATSPDDPALHPHHEALAQELTRTGSILGTPAYMAPEQWQGAETDARTDQFSYCVALWEALFGERPFRGATLAVLFAAILDGTITPPRDAGRVPAWLRRALERGLAVDPAARWPSMEALLAELARDRQARLRRRAAVVGGVALLAIAGVGAQQLLERRASEQRAVARAERADQDAREAARAAEQARDEATERLRQSLLVQAAATQRNVDPGRRFSSLEAIAEAAAISSARGMTPDARMDLRNRAIIGLSLPDARRVRQWPHRLYAANWLSFDPELARYAGSDRQGNIAIRRASDDVTLAEIPSPRADTWYVHLDLGPRRLAVSYATHTHFAAANQFFDLDDRGAALLWSTDDASCFDAGLDTGVVRRRDGRLDVVEPASGRVLRELRTRSKFRGTDRLALDPSGRYLALCGEQKCEVIDLTDDVHLASLEALCWTSPAWSSSGLLAVPRDRDVAVWDVHTGETYATLKGHVMGVISLAFHPDNRLLASGSWDGTTRVWDWTTGAELLRLQGSLVRLRADGAQLVTRGGPHIHLWDFDPGAELRSFPGSAAVVDFSADSRLLVVAGEGGVRIWDIERQRRLWHSVHRHCFAAYFDPRAPGLYTDCSEGGLQRRALAVAPGGDLELGPPRSLRPPLDDEYHVLAWPPPTSPWLATNLDPKQIQLLDAATLAAGPRLPSPRAIRDLALSPDGRWLASSSYRSDKLFVWELAHPEVVHPLPGNDDGLTFFAFTPDSRALLTDVGGSYTLWDLETRQPRASSANSHEGSSLPVAISPDGRTVAVIHDGESVHLLDARDFGLLAELPLSRFYASQLRFSPDGRWLAIVADRGGVHLWDLARLRAGLRRLDLDW